ncbi:class I SAM-dependent DNA methyltransferase [Phaeospirillum tilakii]|uniref:site-specific DNA-methyltransferase (adenine-specific) n=1 Tax=Phaeospirillum tilakii TaxID=741673 RepID=A0ABW5CD35_9PROT
MTPEQFIERWRGTSRSEQSAAHEHFLDLCELLDVSKPQELDRRGDFYTFEKTIPKANGRPGRADVWKKGCFAWEYKRDKRNLVAAYAQLKEYSGALENPPLLIVSDMEEIRVHTNFTNAIVETHCIRLPDLMSVEARQLLRHCFSKPEMLRRESLTRVSVTRDAARAFGTIAGRLRTRGYDPRRVAHFLNRLVFCLFVQDVELLPNRLFADILEECVKVPDKFEPGLKTLFGAMKSPGGMFGMVSIRWFNGGLFDDDDVLPLGWMEIRELHQASLLDWSAIEPSIFGTLFEAGLNPEKRDLMAALFDPPAGGASGAVEQTDKGIGIHYTDPDTIMKIIEPVVLDPLRQEWQEARGKIERYRKSRDKAASDSARTRAENEAREIWHRFRQRLGDFRVLDPACGSGNFLYLALLHLKDFEQSLIKEAGELGLPLIGQLVTTKAVRGIEVNPYAAELARTTIWIGELQWQLKNASDLAFFREPVLGRLDAIECRDALLDDNGKEAPWPEADVIVGNPPFLGGKKLRGSLGDAYVDRLFSVYRGRVPAEADLVAYWFVRSWERVQEGPANAAGLVATNSIRGGANRRVLDSIVTQGRIFSAWSDEPWVIDGAAVRVSLVAFAAAQPKEDAILDGSPVPRIHSDLTAAATDLTRARRLRQNAGVAFMGDTKGGAFDIPGSLARAWLELPSNPHGRPNADVLRPWVNGMDVTRRPADKWIINFGWEMKENDAALYEAPFTYIERMVKSDRLKNRRDLYRKFWWRHAEPRPGMWRAIGGSSQFIVTNTVSKYRFFSFIDKTACPDHQLIVITRDDNVTFGILHSRFHEAWALRLGTSLEDRPRYTPSTTFETFPFPEGLTLDIPATAYADDPRAQAIAAAARRLDELRRNWLNPPDLVKVVPEVVPGFPDRLIPVSSRAEAELKTRTLTNLYNLRPTWLVNAHRELDQAVARAYGWTADISDDEALARLFALNRARAEAEDRLARMATQDRRQRSLLLPMQGGKASDDRQLEQDADAKIPREEPTRPRRRHRA